MIIDVPIPPRTKGEEGGGLIKRCFPLFFVPIEGHRNSRRCHCTSCFIFFSSCRLPSDAVGGTVSFPWCSPVPFCLFFPPPPIRSTGV